MVRELKPQFKEIFADTEDSLQDKIRRFSKVFGETANKPKNGKIKLFPFPEEVVKEMRLEEKTASWDAILREPVVYVPYDKEGQINLEEVEHVKTVSHAQAYFIPALREIVENPGLIRAMREYKAIFRCYAVMRDLELVRKNVHSEKIELEDTIERLSEKVREDFQPNGTPGEKVIASLRKKHEDKIKDYTQRIERAAEERQGIEKQLISLEESLSKENLMQELGKAMASLPEIDEGDSFLFNFELPRYGGKYLFDRDTRELAPVKRGRAKFLMGAGLASLVLMAGGVTLLSGKHGQEPATHEPAIVLESHATQGTYYVKRTGKQTFRIDGKEYVMEIMNINTTGPGPYVEFNVAGEYSGKRQEGEFAKLKDGTVFYIKDIEKEGITVHVEAPGTRPRIMSKFEHLKMGVPKTYNLGGREYEIELVYVNAHEKEVKFKVNGEITDVLEEREEFTLADQTVIGVDVIDGPRIGFYVRPKKEIRPATAEELTDLVKIQEPLQFGKWFIERYRVKGTDKVKYRVNGEFTDALGEAEGHTFRDGTIVIARNIEEGGVWMTSRKLIKETLDDNKHAFEKDIGSIVDVFNYSLPFMMGNALAQGAELHTEEWGTLTYDRTDWDNHMVYFKKENGKLFSMKLKSGDGTPIIGFERKIPEVNEDYYWLFFSKEQRKISTARLEDKPAALELSNEFKEVIRKYIQTPVKVKIEGREYRLDDTINVNVRKSLHPSAMPYYLMFVGEMNKRPEHTPIGIFIEFGYDLKPKCRSSFIAKPNK